MLLDGEAEAEEATRLGVRRLLMLRAKGALSTIVPKLPAPLTKASGAPPAKDEDKLVRATLLARVVDELDIDYGGDAIDIGFNVTYLIDALANISQEMVKLELQDGNASALLTVPERAGFKYVVMPMRI